MPSIPVKLPQQAGQKSPLEPGLPHFWQKGGKSRGNVLVQLAHKKLPDFPHPKQRRGKKKSTSTSWSCPDNKDKATTPKAVRVKSVVVTIYYTRERGLGPVPLKIGSFKYTSPFLILML
jgi:hypothetical protein